MFVHDIRLRTALVAGLAIVVCLLQPASCHASGHVLAYHPPVAPADVPSTDNRSMGVFAQRAIAAANSATGTATRSHYREALVMMERYARSGGNMSYAAMIAAQLGRAFAVAADVSDARRSWRLVAAESTVGEPGWPDTDRAFDRLTAAHRSADILQELGAAFEARTRNQPYLSTTSTSTPDGRPDRDLHEALNAMSAGNFAEAQRSLDAAVKLDPDFTVAWLCAGALAFEQGNRSTAVHDWILATTASAAYASPDIRTYATADNVRAARLLIAVTKKAVN